MDQEIVNLIFGLVLLAPLAYVGWIITAKVTANLRLERQLLELTKANVKPSKPEHDAAMNPFRDMSEEELHKALQAAWDAQVNAGHKAMEASPEERQAAMLRYGAAYLTYEQLSCHKQVRAQAKRWGE